MESILISFCRTIFGVICDILILAAAKVLRGVTTKPGAKHIMKNRYFLIRISFKFIDEMNFLKFLCLRISNSHSVTFKIQFYSTAQMYSIVIFCKMPLKRTERNSQLIK